MADEVTPVNHTTTTADALEHRHHALDAARREAETLQAAADEAWARLQDIIRAPLVIETPHPTTMMKLPDVKTVRFCTADTRGKTLDDMLARAASSVQSILPEGLHLRYDNIPDEVDNPDGAVGTFYVWRDETPAATPKEP